MNGCRGAHEPTLGVIFLHLLGGAGILYIATILKGVKQGSFFLVKGPPRTNFHCQVAASVFSKQKDRRCLEGSARKKWSSFRFVSFRYTPLFFLFSLVFFVGRLTKKVICWTKNVVVFLGTSFWEDFLDLLFCG